MLWGAEDRPLPVAAGERFASELGRPAPRLIDGAGHFLQEDRGRGDRRDHRRLALEPLSVLARIPSSHSSEGDVVCAGRSCLPCSLPRWRWAAPAGAWPPDGKRWRALTETTGVTAAQLAAVCPRDGETRCAGRPATAT